MSNNVKISIGLVVVAVIAIIGLFTPRFVQPKAGAVTVTPTTNLSSLGVGSLAVGSGCDQDYTNSACLGSGGTAAAGQEMMGGVGTYAQKITMTAATTTPCAFLSPNATSSITSLGINLTTSTSTATTWTFATSTNAFATTSVMAIYPVAAANQATIVWNGLSTSPIVAPNTYVVVGVAGVVGQNGKAAGLATSAGTCQLILNTF